MMCEKILACVWAQEGVDRVVGKSLMHQSIDHFTYYQKHTYRQKPKMSFGSMRHRTNEYQEEKLCSKKKKISKSFFVVVNL